MHNFHHLMRDWMHEVDAGRLTELEATARVAKYIQMKLACTRVNFWNVCGDIGHRIMHRVVGYDGSKDQVSSLPFELRETDGRAIFGTIFGRGCYVCSDTASDPNLAFIQEGYLVAAVSRAVMVASFGANGNSLGLISCVQSAPRESSSSEITALRKCAAEISVRRARRQVRPDLS